MDRIHVVGGVALKGTISISGAKNAALPLMAASLLTDEKLVLQNMPALADINCMIELLSQHGVSCAQNDHVLTLHGQSITSVVAPYDIVRKMRAAILALGPLVARQHEAVVSLPGGCAIGVRPVDLHIKGLEAMGAEIVIEEGYIHAKAPGGLKGADFEFPIVSVTGTENLLMAACLANGHTRLINAAKEPEVCDLANCLVAMGAQIKGIGTSVLEIEGVERLHGATYSVLPDRIETGTYAIAAAITGGEIDLIGTHIGLLPTFIDTLRQTGVEVTEIANGIKIKSSGQPIRSVNMETQPYPGFPTDLQAQFMALMVLADGESHVHETIWENRFMHVAELTRFGADISVEGSHATVRGVPQLKAAPVMATDLRASVSLILAALAAEGESIVHRVYHLDRGYERIEEKLSACGAQIWREKEEASEESQPALSVVQ
jgi:UDP-N-acetylglucosamine 1-carboxyvinyltransferase